MDGRCNNWESKYNSPIEFRSGKLFANEDQYEAKCDAEYIQTLMERPERTRYRFGHHLVDIQWSYAGNCTYYQTLHDPNKHQHLQTWYHYQEA